MAQALQAEPDGTEGEKNFEKILAPPLKVLEIVATQTTS